MVERGRWVEVAVTGALSTGHVGAGAPVSVTTATATLFIALQVHEQELRVRCHAIIVAHTPTATATAAAAAAAHAVGVAGHRAADVRTVAIHLGYMYVRTRVLYRDRVYIGDI